MTGESTHRLHAGSHVDRFYRHPVLLDADHDSQSLIQAPHSPAADNGQRMVTLLWPRTHSTWISVVANALESDAGCAGETGTYAFSGSVGTIASTTVTGKKVGAACLPSRSCSRSHRCNTLGLTSLAWAIAAMEAPGW